MPTDVAEIRSAGAFRAAWLYITRDYKGAVPSYRNIALVLLAVALVVVWASPRPDSVAAYQWVTWLLVYPIVFGLMQAFIHARPVRRDRAFRFAVTIMWAAAFDAFFLASFGVAAVVALPRGQAPIEIITRAFIPAVDPHFFGLVVFGTLLIASAVIHERGRRAAQLAR